MEINRFNTNYKHKMKDLVLPQHCVDYLFVVENSKLKYPYLVFHHKRNSNKNLYSFVMGEHDLGNLVNPYLGPDGKCKQENKNDCVYGVDYYFLIKNKFKNIFGELSEIFPQSFISYAKNRKIISIKTQSMPAFITQHGNEEPIYYENEQINRHSGIVYALIKETETPISYYENLMAIFEDNLIEEYILFIDQYDDNAPSGTFVVLDKVKLVKPGDQYLAETFEKNQTNLTAYMEDNYNMQSKYIGDASTFEIIRITRRSSIGILYYFIESDFDNGLLYRPTGENIDENQNSRFIKSEKNFFILDENKLKIIFSNRFVEQYGEKSQYLVLSVKIIGGKYFVVDENGEEEQYYYSDEMFNGETDFNSAGYLFILINIGKSNEKIKELKKYQGILSLLLLDNSLELQFIIPNNVYFNQGDDDFIVIDQDMDLISLSFDEKELISKRKEEEYKMLETEKLIAIAKQQIIVEQKFEFSPKQKMNDTPIINQKELHDQSIENDISSEISEELEDHNNNTNQISELSQELDDQKKNTIHNPENNDVDEDFTTHRVIMNPRDIPYREHYNEDEMMATLGFGSGQNGNRVKQNDKMTKYQGMQFLI